MDGTTNAKNERYQAAAAVAKGSDRVGGSRSAAQPNSEFMMWHHTDRVEISEEARASIAQKQERPDPAPGKGRA